MRIQRFFKLLGRDAWMLLYDALLVSLFAFALGVLAIAPTGVILAYLGHWFFGYPVGFDAAGCMFLLLGFLTICGYGLFKLVRYLMERWRDAL